MANKVLVVLDGKYLIKNEESKTMVDLLEKLDVLYWHSDLEAIDLELATTSEEAAEALRDLVNADFTLIEKGQESEEALRVGATRYATVGEHPNWSLEDSEAFIEWVF